jgi:uncharacterized Zn ribbon protein
MIPTINPLRDAEVHADAEQTRADANETQSTRERRIVRDAVLNALLAGDTAAVVPHVSINGKTIHVQLTEILADYRHELDAHILRLIAAGLTKDYTGCHTHAQSLSVALQDLHADDVVERLELAGEVLA